MDTYSFKNPKTGETFEVDVTVSGEDKPATWYSAPEDMSIDIETELPDWLTEAEVIDHVYDIMMDHDGPEPDEPDCDYEYDYYDRW